MVGPEIVLWEGHHNTLVRDWGFPSWDESMPPALVFLQSCLALQDYKVSRLQGRGALAVIGSSTRVYSASGGAFSLAYFNSLLYDGRPLGGALRHAKNFLTCYVELKQKRLGDQVARAGANHRAAWAFTLWGDPTFHLPRPVAPARPAPGVRHEVVRGDLVIHLPTARHERVSTSRFSVRMPPNGRLAGLVRKQAEEDETQPLVPFVFVEASLPKAPAGAVPKLRSRAPDHDWSFTWDARRKVLHVLVAPRRLERTPLRFKIDWVENTVAHRGD